MTGANRGGKYPDEMRERGVRMVFEHQDEYPSQWKAIEFEVTVILLRQARSDKPRYRHK